MNLYVCIILRKTSFLSLYSLQKFTEWRHRYFRLKKNPHSVLSVRDIHMAVFSFANRKLEDLFAILNPRKILTTWIYFKGHTSKPTSTFLERLRGVNVAIFSCAACKWVLRSAYKLSFLLHFRENIKKEGALSAQHKYLNGPMNDHII